MPETDRHPGVKLASARVNVSHPAQRAASPTIGERNLGTGVCSYFDVFCKWLGVMSMPMRLENIMTMTTFSLTIFVI